MKNAKKIPASGYRLNLNVRGRLSLSKVFFGYIYLSDDYSVYKKCKKFHTYKRIIES